MSDLKIRELLFRFENGDIVAHDLEDRLEEVAWDLEDEPDRTLAATVLRLLAEYDNGDWTEEDLREKLGALSRFYWFEQAPKTVILDSTSLIILHYRQTVATGRSRVAEFV